MERIAWTISSTDDDRNRETIRRCIVDKLLLARFGRGVVHTGPVIQNSGGSPSGKLVMAYSKNLSRTYNARRTILAPAQRVLVPLNQSSVSENF